MADSPYSRPERAARNQSMFRVVNEQLEKIGHAANGDRSERIERFVCECADFDCTEPVELTIDEYESVRRSGSTFVVAPGHVYPDVERVTFEHERFTLVEKIEAAAELADAHDPRR